MNGPTGVLLIVADQLRADCVGCAGGQPVSTPHIDRLAREGILFTHAFSHIPVCSPARQSFMNGRRPESFGALWNYDLGPRVSSLSAADYVWPRELARRSFRSAYAGKWHVHPTADPTAFGYGEYAPETDYRVWRQARYPDEHFTGGWAGETDPVPLDDSETHRMALWAAERVIAFAKSGHPWHVRLDFSAPHLPSRPARPFADQYRAQDIPAWENFAETFAGKPYIQRQQLVSWGIDGYGWDDFAPMVARYFGMVSQVDDAVGRVLAALDQAGAADDTLVVFTADHGDMCGAHRMLDKHCVMYDDIVRVPLVLRWPRGLPAGLRIGELVYNFLDLPPTLLDLLGIEPDGACWHGRSLAPLLRGESDPKWREQVISTYNGQQFGLYTERMIRTRRWKYVWNATDVDELYDLQEDPSELANRIQDPGAAAVLRELRRQLYEELVAQDDRALDNDWVRRQLLAGRKL